MIAKSIPSSIVWEYHNIIPSKASYNVGDTLELTSIYSSKFSIPIIWNDFLKCAGDDTLSARKNAIYIGQITKGDNLESRWTFGNTDNSDAYSLKKEGTGCYIKSIQTVEILGINRVQTFISESFDIGKSE